MSQCFKIHPVNPQLRLIRQVVNTINEGGLVVYPTDSCYALGCHLGNKSAMERINRIRQLDKQHNFTLMCSDLSEISSYAKVDNSTYRLLKNLTPGPYTFILQATHEVPRRLQNPKRKTIGIRVPEHPIVHMMLEELAQPIMSSTLIMPGDDMPLNDPDEIYEQLHKHVDMIVDGGHCGLEPTSVIVIDKAGPMVAREGKGDTSFI